MRVGTDAHGWIARWMDRLTEYDYVIKHRPCKATIMGLADGMSRIPGKYSQLAFAENAERMAMVLSHPQQRRSTLPIQRTHTRYRKSRWYGPVVSFLLDRPETLKGLGKNEARNIKRTSFRYQLADQHLLYVENSGETAKRLLPFEVKRILTWAHDEHGHFSVAITLHKLRGQWWWPSRTADVEKYC